MENTNNNRPVAIQLSGVKKMYKLGQIGGGTLTADLQSWWARVRGKEDPNSKIGTDQRLIGKSFMALNGIDLTVYQGEALGIIGGNGAGKSTMLKLLSRVTAPTEGEIDIYGRIASMLEVGTGFNGEMTGRENIYMNGAILGMAKAEIDAKMEDIIEFSEVREFIDTPVKRYSSGMYVKLAFSVAAHLDSEIMIMDEVLAVGDMAFQKKCLDKMRDAAKKQGRTVLYVSHNMNTIRRLCDRCVVLDKGRIAFQGDTEEAINIYLGLNNSSEPIVDLREIPRDQGFDNGPATMERLELENDSNVFFMNSTMRLKLIVSSREDFDDALIGVFFLYQGTAITSMKTQPNVVLRKNIHNIVELEVDLSRLAPGSYTTKLVLSRNNNMGGVTYLDMIGNAFGFTIKQADGFMLNQQWSIRYNGYLTGSEVKVLAQREGY